MGFDKPQLHTNFEVASFSHCTNIKGEPHMLWSSSSPRPRHFFFWVEFMMGLGKPQLHAKFEVVGFIYYGNTRKFVSLNGINQNREAPYFLEKLSLLLDSQTQCVLFEVSDTTFVEL